VDTSRSDPRLAKVEVDARDAAQRTALHFACAKRAPPHCAQVVADLLYRKANPCIADATGMTPLDVARRARCQLCVRTIEDSTKLWQGWVDYDERGLLGLPNWAPRWLVILRDRHPNTGPFTWSPPTMQCYNCQGTVTATMYSFNLPCPRCGTDNGVTPSVQLALYAVPEQQAAQRVLPDSAVPVAVMPVPASPAQRVVRIMDDASWTTAAGALFQGRVRRALQSTPTSDRAFGVKLKLLGGPGCAHAELSFRVASASERTQLMEVLQDPGKAAYESWCAHMGGPAPAQAEAASAPASAPAPWASQALAAYEETPGAPAPAPPAPPEEAPPVRAEAWRAGAAELEGHATSGEVSAPPAEAQERDSELCVVCLERQADTAVVPCGHLCGCERCLRATMSAGSSPAACPMCRGPMVSVIRIFRG